MEATVKVADSAGKIIDAGRPGGFGFRISPAADYDAANALRPGSFPLKVVFRGGMQRPITIVNSDTKYFAEKHDGFTIEGAESGDAFLVEEYFNRHEGSIPSGSKVQRTIAVQVATAVPTIDPTLSTEGFKIRPGTVAHHFYFSGNTARTAEVWVRTKSGVWYGGGVDATLDPSTGPIFTRFQYANADRIYLKASGAGLLVEIDANIEVG